VKKTMRIYYLIAGLALCIFSAAAGAQFNLNLNRLFDTAKNLKQAGTELNEQQEAAIGKEYASLLVGAAPLYDNADVQRYVNRVGRWLSLNSERPDLNWQFGVLDSENINAFATPGGYVFITKGLLGRLKSEAELAGVLAHEIAHVVKKHHLTALQKSAGMQAGANILSEFAAQRGSNQYLSNQLIGGIKEVTLRGLDKDDEFEADRMAVVIAARSGYDPFGLPAVLQMLAGMNPEDSGLALLFSTHPTPVARLDTLERIMSTRLDQFSAQPEVTQRFTQTMLGPQAASQQK
jgi:beta-barrel assembly-enhancing protease